MKKFTLCSLFALLLMATFSLKAQNTENILPEKVSVLTHYEEEDNITHLNFATAFLKQYDLSNETQFALIKTTKDNLGFTHYKYNQVYQNIEVFGFQIVLHEKNKIANSLNGKVLKNISVNTKPTLTKEEAIAKAKKMVDEKKYYWDNKTTLKTKGRKLKLDFSPVPELSIVAKNGLNEPYRLCWKFNITAISMMDNWTLFIDATTGELVKKIALSHSADLTCSGPTNYHGNQTFQASYDPNFLSNTLYEEASKGPTSSQVIWTLTAQNDASLNNIDEIYSTTTTFTSDPEANSVHWGMGKTYDFFYNTFQQNSFDNQGTPIINFVHYGVGVSNAGWTGVSNMGGTNVGIMIYGDGDGINYNPFVALDVEGHELSHGVTSSTSMLVYEGESGALNESFSDMMAVGVEQYTLGTSYNWKIGENLGISGITHLRNMANPANAPTGSQQPDTYNGTFYINTVGCIPSTSNDNCGVHINSGVINYWFYLLSQGGSGTNDNGFAYNMSGISLSNALKIAYRMNTTYLTNSADFSDAVIASKQSAIDIFGAGSNEVAKVNEAWCAVGLSTNCFPATVFDLKNSSISVFPNPSSGIIHINDVQEKDVQATVLDMMGAVLFNTTLQKQNNLVDLSHLSNGVYTIVLNNNRSSVYKKVTIQQ